MKKKLLLITEAMGAGVLSNIENICRSLSDRYEITLLYSKRTETPDENELKQRFSGGIQLIPIKTSRMFKFWGLFYAYYFYIKKIEPDIIHLHSSFAGFIGRLVLLFINNKCKVFYSPHCFGFMRHDLNKIKQMIFYSIEVMANRLPGEIIAVSKSEQSIAQKLGNKRTHYVYNTVIDSLDLNHTKEKSDALMTIGMIGRLSVQKNPSLFVKLAKSVCIHYENVRFIWIGGGELEGDIRGEIKKAGLSDKIEITGWIDRRQVLEILSKLDIYLHTADWEALPISVLEAMRAGKPVVIKHFPGVEELVKDQYNGFISDNFEELKESLIQLIENGRLRETLGNNSEQLFKQEFNPLLVMNKLSRIYES